MCMQHGKDDVFRSVSFLKNVYIMILFTVYI
jgi:hypothetical protein